MDEKRLVTFLVKIYLMKRIYLLEKIYLVKKIKLVIQTKIHNLLLYYNIKQSQSEDKNLESPRYESKQDKKVKGGIKTFSLAQLQPCPHQHSSAWSNLH